jgi:hypothetical protein
VTRSGMDSNDLTRLDLNDVSRFIDQQMDEPEHDSAVAHLSTSDADAELVADATYMLGDLEAQDAEFVSAGVGASDEAGVIPFAPPSTTRTRPRRIPARWLALAAVLAGVMLTPLALSRGRAGDAGDFAVLLAERQSGLPAGWIERSRPWSVQRGGGDAVIDDALAARLGALHLDLELAVAGRQAEQTEDVAGQITARLDNSGIGAVAIAAAPYREISARAGEEPDALAPLLAQGRKSIVGFVSGDAFDLGAWAEAARLAAHQRDAAFFGTRASRKMLDRAASLDTLDEETRTSIDALREAGRADGEPDWAAVARHADQLLRHLAG